MGANDGPDAGMRMREAHFPDRAPIDAYGDGGFRFADMSHRGSLLCLPSGIYGWSVSGADELVIANFAKVFEEAGDIEILLVGCGEALVPIEPALRGLSRVPKEATGEVSESPKPSWIFTPNFSSKAFITSTGMGAPPVMQ